MQAENGPTADNAVLARRLIVPAIISAIVIATTLSLGFWQVKRLAWKNDLIATMERQMAAPPETIETVIYDPAGWNFRPVSVTGIFRHDQEFHLVSHLRPQQNGYEILTPLQLAEDGRGDGKGATILVNRGWVPADLKNASKRADGQIPGVVVVTGTARTYDKRGAFVPEDDAAGNIWFHSDVVAMSDVAGYQMMPVVVVAQKTRPAEASQFVSPEFPAGRTVSPKLVNNHLMYAITWFSFSVIMAAVFLIYARRIRRSL